MRLREINDALRGRWGIDVSIDDEGAARLRSVASRERFIEAVRTGPDDADAHCYVRRALAAAGYTVEAGPGGAETSEVRGDDPAPSATGGDADTGGEGEGPGGRAWARRWSVHVYGQKAAATIEADTTRAGQATVIVEAALVRSSGGGFDWANKVRVQLTPGELVEFTAVLYGALTSCRFTNRGDSSDKSLRLERQHSNNDELSYFLRVAARGAHVRALPVTRADALWVTGLCTAQLQRAYPWMDEVAIEPMLRAVLT